MMLDVVLLAENVSILIENIGVRDTEKKKNIYIYIYLKKKRDGGGLKVALHREVGIFGGSLRKIWLSYAFCS